VVIRIGFSSFVLLACFAVQSQADDAKLVSQDKPPANISEKIQAKLNPAGQQVKVGDRSVCTVWIAKEVTVKPDFKPSLSVKYPFSPGQLIGVLEVMPKSDFTDFRGQAIASGTYTLRYGQQPVDGNHVGTSELADFLLAIPAKLDEDPAPTKAPEPLFKSSAKSSGSNHPAIFSLLPPKANEKSPSLTKDSSNGYEILSLSTTNEQKAAVPLRLVVIGRSEG
jgi:hypothetical protein